jgi:acyl-CoA thioester hydrolase
LPTQTDSQDITKIAYYAHWTKERVRYNDTDRQGHVNNAVFVTFLEAGRVSLLYDPQKRALTPEGTSFVLANLALNFRAEILWPSEVRIGTTVSRMGNSSVTFSQALFVGDNCVATAQTVLVLIDDATRKSRSLPDQTRRELEKWRRRNGGMENVATSGP